MDSTTTTTQDGPGPDFSGPEFQSPGNGSRRPADPQSRRVIVEALAQLLAAGSSVTAAAEELSAHTGWHASTIRRWGAAAGLTPRTKAQLGDVEARLNALLTLNRSMAAQLQQRRN